MQNDAAELVYQLQPFTIVHAHSASQRQLCTAVLTYLQQCLSKC